MKLRANGSHSAIAYLGAMAGWKNGGRSDRAARDARLRAFAARRGSAADAADAACAGLRALRAGGLLERFGNPALAHRLQQIAMDGSQKLPQRLLATIEQKAAAGAADRAPGARGGRLDALPARHRRMGPPTIDDPQAAALAEAARRSRARADAARPRRRLHRIWRRCSATSPATRRWWTR
ncbi:MAG: hypothetical protein U1F67_19015 [Rubrivivax sp.]